MILINKYNWRFITMKFEEPKAIKSGTNKSLKKQISYKRAKGI